MQNLWYLNFMPAIKPPAALFQAGISGLKIPYHTVLAAVFANSIFILRLFHHYLVYSEYHIKSNIEDFAYGIKESGRKASNTDSCIL